VARDFSFADRRRECQGSCIRWGRIPGRRPPSTTQVMSRLSSVRTFLQACYSFSASAEGWLHGLAISANAALGQDLGALAVQFDASNPNRVTVRAAASTRRIQGLHSLVDDALSGLDRDYVQESLGKMVATANSNRGPAQSGITDYMAKVGARDMVALTAADPSGLGVLVLVHQSSACTLEASEFATLARLAMHISSASQLRSEESDASEAAVFRPDGHLVRADDDALEGDSVAALRRAVLATSALRSNRGTAESALERLTSRVDAQWTVVSRFIEGSDEFVVARRNRPPVLQAPGMDALSIREREVVSFLALGHSQKAIAYELGLSPSTVRVLIARARLKLGARSGKSLARRLVRRAS